MIEIITSFLDQQNYFKKLVLFRTKKMKEKAYMVVF